jgi:hypothetical protein
VTKRKADGYFDLAQRSGKKTVAIFQWNGEGYARSSTGDERTDIERWGADCEVANDQR